MCGIAGELSFSAPVDPAALQRMTEALVERGPDDEGRYCEGRIGLGHRRLSIIDLSPTGRQPMWTADKKLAMVFNGEIYNHRELRPLLEAEGCRFQGTSDTEVAVHAVQRWGLEGALARFVGMFAFALWDSRERALYLVRDRLGVKPLFYCRAPGTLLFASQLKALRAHPAFSRRLDPRGLGQFFCFGYTLGADTVFQDTFKVPAGHYLRVSEDGKLSCSRYWSLDAVKRGEFQGSFEDAAQGLSKLCDSAFRYRLESDVPVAVFLSGGIDSTFLAAFLKRRLGVDLEHITIGFDEREFDEVPQSRAVAKALGLRHTVKTVDARSAQDALLRFADIWDEPFGDTSGIPTSILCSEARQQAKVVLSADGGDELFCGYESYPQYERRFTQLGRVPRPLRRGASRMMSLLPHRPLLSALMGGTDSGWNPQFLARYEKAVSLLDVDRRPQLLQLMNSKGWTTGSVADLIKAPLGDLVEGTAFADSGDGRGLIDHMMRTDLSAFLGDDILTKVDRASMAVSLECREPFLDHRLVEYAFALPMRYLYEDGKHKRILKHLLEPWIPPAVLEAPKRGFSIPLYRWLRGPWKDIVHDHLSSARVSKVGVLHWPTVERELADFYRYRGGRAEKIMLMLNFQMWAERWL